MRIKPVGAQSQADLCGRPLQPYRPPSSEGPMRACCHFNCVQLCATPNTVAFRAPLSMRFSRQEYRSGLPCPPPGDLSDLGTHLMSACFSCIAHRWILYPQEPREALQSQEKQDWDLTVAQIMNSLLQNSDLNGRK